jgi:hypothetical protein
MVWGEVEKDRNVRPKRVNQLQLKTTQLGHNVGLVVRAIDKANQRSADIARKNSGQAVALQNVRNQTRGCRFAIRTGNADEATAEMKKPVRKLNFAPNGDALAARGNEQ